MTVLWSTLIPYFNSTDHTFLLKKFVQSLKNYSTLVWDYIYSVLSFADGLVTCFKKIELEIHFGRNLTFNSPNV